MARLPCANDFHRGPPHASSEIIKRKRCGTTMQCTRLETYDNVSQRCESKELLRLHIKDIVTNHLQFYCQTSERRPFTPKLAVDSNLEPSTLIVFAAVFIPKDSQGGIMV